MERISKKEYSARLFQKNISLFKCPYCGQPLQIENEKSLICSKRHTFDLAKQGSVNLLVKPSHTEYDQELFACRRRMMRDVGLFRPLLEWICDKIRRNHQSKALAILDVGCGEGTHLNQIVTHLQASGYPQTLGVGIDIAKDGVTQAAKNYPGNLWLVANLAHAPVSDQSFDIILNILSPSHYESFHRIAMTGGWTIKVVPASGYLKELRTFFHGESEKQAYSNESVIANFRNHYSTFETHALTYERILSGHQLFDLMRMTPLSWHASESKKKEWLSQQTCTITVDLSILIGKEGDQ